ncbi:O-antigen/teichoic acid export membrane protein [Algoriphagus sp. 4150]|uniref:oligosaccharide flippase family protein n=1 Tax=Algoriphagus sp. 4150 TaxID=2817756 RepID=UPI00285D2106|nr:oligosaccharide flippase family protein [Algoriphagus sp. 4150]MDR7130551.1 O-antigen/teichoic acid export membrane protein [Algoriphagus sp. 4150]
MNNDWIDKFHAYPKIHALLQRAFSSEIFKRILRGSFWNAVLNFFSKGVSFIGTVIIIRLIGKEAYGEFGMLNSTIAMFGMFTTFSISQTATKHIAEFRDLDKPRAGRIIGLSFLFSGALGLLIFIIVQLTAGLLAENSLEAPHLEGSLRLMAAGMLFGSLNGAQYGVVNGLEAFKENSFLGIALGIFLTLVKIALTYWFGFFGAVLGMTVEPLITYLATFYLVRKLLTRSRLKIMFSGALKEYKILFNYSLPSLLSGLLIFPTNWYTMSLLATRGGGYDDLADFNVANQWFNVLIFITYILVSSFLPIFADLWAKKQYNQVNRIVKSASLTIIAVFIPICLVFLIFGESIATIYGPEYAGTGMLIFVSVFTLIPQSLCIVLNNVLVATGRTWTSLLIFGAWSICFIGLTFALLSLSSMGLVLARLIAFLVYLLVLVWVYINFYKKSSIQSQIF